MVIYTNSWWTKVKKDSTKFQSTSARSNLSVTLNRACNFSLIFYTPIIIQNSALSIQLSLSVSICGSGIECALERRVRSRSINYVAVSMHRCDDATLTNHFWVPVYTHEIFQQGNELIHCWVLPEATLLHNPFWLPHICNNMNLI